MRTHTCWVYSLKIILERAGVFFSSWLLHSKTPAMILRTHGDAGLETRRSLEPCLHELRGNFYLPLIHFEPTSYKKLQVPSLGQLTTTFSCPESRAALQFWPRRGARALIVLGTFQLSISRRVVSGTLLKTTALCETQRGLFHKPKGCLFPWPHQ
jgi:hypothetical protein